ncbi:MAG: prepilin-type N-terminal cleavage/methylation domain-containing protein [Opitutus sp.]
MADVLRSSWLSRRSPAFTLVELLIVLALVGGISGLLLGGLGEGSGAASLRSNRATLASQILVARTQAIASGKSTRLLINLDAVSPRSPSRFLRYIVVQAQSASGWRTVSEAMLSEGVYLVPGDFALPSGLFAQSVDAWIRVDGATSLRSSALRATQITTEAIESATAEKWVSVSFSGSGTTAQAGDLILTLGRNRSPTSYTPGQAPAELISRDQVCGVTLSSYGIAVLIGNRASF